MKTLDEIFAELKAEEIKGKEELLAAVKKLGGEFSAEEIMAYIKDHTGKAEMDEDALEQAAGGFSPLGKQTYKCPTCGTQVGFNALQVLSLSIITCPTCGTRVQLPYVNTPYTGE